MKIIKYTYDYKERWDDFVNTSKNGTFLFLRDYMDYHSDRFDDFSLICIDNKNNIIATLPANKCDDSLYSHQGLTYGGWITSVKGITATTMLEIWQLMTNYLKENGIKRLIYKSMPYIYHRYPADEDQYAIFRFGGQILSTQISTTLPLDNSRLRFNENARRGLKKAIANNITIEHCSDFTIYWNILTQMLKECHNTLPVHTLDEITLLHNRFPENIKLFIAKRHDEVVGGVVMFYTHMVAHAQYIAASPQGKALNVLPLIFDHIINNDCGNCRWFDFGTSNEDGGKFLNDGLITQKCGMGGRGVAYNIYELKIE